MKEAVAFLAISPESPTDCVADPGCLVTESVIISGYLFYNSSTGWKKVSIPPECTHALRCDVDSGYALDRFFKTYFAETEIWPLSKAYVTIMKSPHYK